MFRLVHGNASFQKLYHDIVMKMVNYDTHNADNVDINATLEKPSPLLLLLSFKMIVNIDVDGATIKSIPMFFQCDEILSLHVDIGSNVKKC
jgi:hypothetical protein